MPAEQRQMVTAGLVLAAAALLGTSLLSLAQWHSEPYIAANRQQALLDSLRILIPADSFDNEILNDQILISDPGLLGRAEPTRVYRARWRGEPQAAAFRIVAPDGYAGDIELLLGVRADGVVSGVRVISHRETPGLGDGIEARRSDWIQGFGGRSLDDPGEAGWRVKRDGGVFDQFSGATITPRAVVKAVRNGLRFFARYRKQIFADNPPASSVASSADLE